MYTGNLAAASNRADWISAFELVDDETDALVDLSAATITFELRDPVSKSALISATTGNGRVTIPGSGTFVVTIPDDLMRGLSPGQYEIGCIVEIAGVVTQLLAAQVSVIDGVVS